MIAWNAIDEEQFITTQPETKLDASKVTGDLYVVGIGVSTGELEVLEQFFANLPTISNMAFVILQHLSPGFKCVTPEILSKNTDMKVYQIHNEMKILPGCVYLNPPNYAVTISHEQLFLLEQEPIFRVSYTINTFLKSLSENMGEKSIAIIFSGTGNDGSRGCRAIKEVGGLVITQDMTSTKFTGKPKSVISMNLCDFILPPTKIPEKLLKYTSQSPLTNVFADAEQKVEVATDLLMKIYYIIKNRYSVDFSLSRQATVLRCLATRIRICQKPTLEAYLSYLQSNLEEIERLYSSLLISATRTATISELQERISDLEEELNYTKESLQTSQEELKSSREELQPANDELLITNEKMPSINEELPFVNLEQKVKINHFQKLADKLTQENENIKKQLNEAIALNSLESDFFSNLSHELRTPLNVILSTLQLLESQNANNDIKNVPPNLRKHLSIIKQNCYRQLRLINNMIDITKMDSDFFLENQQNHNIVNVIENITLSVSEYVKNKGIALMFSADAEEMITACDLDSIERIMLNLLANAVKFTNPGGNIYVNIKNKGDTLLLSVKDTGIGIPKDKQDIIFDRFRQVDKSLTRNQGGSGIGLSLVKSLVEKQGGKIYVQSEFGYGSAFIIQLPIRLVSEDATILKEERKQHRNVEKIRIEFSDIYNL